jgi:serine/threonine protein kinase
MPGGFVGTPDFASPEQFAGVGVDIRSDLYSLGLMLWKMVTGHALFRGSPAQVMYTVLPRSFSAGPFTAKAPAGRLCPRIAISPTRAGSSGFLGAFADRLTQIKNQRGASKLPPKHPGCASRLTLRYPGKAASTLS